jgi:ketosteroid isomerase-like protein
MGESNAEIARRGYEAASHGDLEVIAGLLDDEVRWHGGDPSEPGACRNSGEALEFKAVEMVHYPNAADALAVVDL